MTTTGTRPRRGWWWFAGVALVVAGLLAFWLWGGGSGTEFTLGAVPLPGAEQLGPGDITTIELEVPHVNRLPLEGNPPGDVPPEPRLVELTRLHVVNHPTLGMLALADRSPWLGCRVAILPQNELALTGREAPEGFEVGFYDPCHGGLFDLDGRHLDGPGRRGLDRFPVTRSEQGNYTVDLTTLQPGPVN